jgi:hypothetical protein
VKSPTRLVFGGFRPKISFLKRNLQLLVCPKTVANASKMLDNTNLAFVKYAEFDAVIFEYKKTG